MAIFYVNGISEEKINETETYVGFSEVSPAYTLDLVGSKVFDNDFVDPVYSSVNPAYNNQKPTFYPFVSSIAGQSVNVAGNTQDPHDNSATVIRVSNDSSSVRSGLFNVVTGNWNSTYVPTTYGYGLCEDREDTLTYAGQDKEYSINTTELTTCDQSTLVLPSITPLPSTPLVTGIFNVGDPSFSFSDITSNLTYNGSLYLDTNNSSTAYEIPEIWFSVETRLNKTYRCNNSGSATVAMVLANSDDSLMYYSAKSYNGPTYQYFSTTTNGFNSFGNWGGGTNTLLPEPIRDRGQLRFDIYTNCDYSFPFEFSTDYNNWNVTTFNTDLANGFYNDKVFVKRFSPELVQSLKTNQYMYLFYYNGDFSEFNFGTDTGWRLAFIGENTLYKLYRGHYFDLYANDTVTSIDFSAVDLQTIYLDNNPNFTHLENVHNYSWLDSTEVRKSDGVVTQAFGTFLNISACPNFTQQNFNEIIDSVYHRVINAPPYTSAPLKQGTLRFTHNLTVDSTRQAKIDAITAAPYNWNVSLNGFTL